MSEDRLDYPALLKRFPWITDRNLRCIISPDADGMLCGLFMAHYLNWQVAGYYDNGKNLIIKKGVRAEECVFVDTEIYRPNVNSIGHHISLLRADNTRIKLDNYRNCLNPNNLRGRTLKENFILKYPMGTIHLLLGIVGREMKIDYAENSYFIILQADGTINRFLDRYSENLYDWLRYLGAEDQNHILNKILRKTTNLIELNRAYVEYVKKFVRGANDKIKISKRGDIIHDSFNTSRTAFSESCANSTKEYLEFLSVNTGWAFKEGNWTFENFGCYEFTKKIVRPGVTTFNRAVDENFLSLAITANDTMEYTIESPDSLKDSAV